jgi:xanthine dehydrogenase accessory factor
MNELQTIVAAFHQIPQGQRAVLATVVHTVGSVYRRSGARLLITEAGERVGVISGGCLENEVEERAQSVLATGEPTLAIYDAIANEDLLWGLGLGCNGLVQILLEPLADHHPLTFVADWLRHRQTGVLATVFRTEGLTTPIATHLMRDPNGDIAHNLRDRELIQRTIVDAHTAFHSRQSRVHHYNLTTGKADVWIEVIQPPPPIVIFGAGQDAIPVAQFAKAIGWHVTVVDRRAAYATRDRFPTADEIKIIRPETGLESLFLDAGTAVVIMTHNYFDDRELLKTLLPASIAYLGLLGPRPRTRQLLADLESEGFRVGSSPHHFHTPVGLDIGAETPEAIALAIVAEIQAVFANRTGGMLRDRKTPIHARSEARPCLPSV